MRVLVHCHGEKFTVNIGDGKQHVRWLGLVTALRYQKLKHQFRIPVQVRNSEGTVLRPRMPLCEEMTDLAEVYVDLREGAENTNNAEEGGLGTSDYTLTWQDEAYGPSSSLRICKFQWKIASNAYDMPIPTKIRGEYTVASQWTGIFPQKEFGGKFEIPLDPVDLGDGNIDWIAIKHAPPGTAKYLFLLEDGSETVCKALPEHTLSGDGSHHIEDFPWEVPIAADPVPDADSRPSTASSVDGAEVDPRFDEDWDSLKLRWIEPHMKLRVKDVLKEFYSILVDLYDSYAFMGLDLAVEDPTAQSAHTIGLDDVTHLLQQAHLLSKGTHVPKNLGQNEKKHMPIPFGDLVKWYQETTQVRDGKPYLSQRLQRNHYLEILLRVAHWTMCEHPNAQKTAQMQQMPLDEGLFRFLTDILIPVMDVYDEDPLRKDAVQHENLVAIQRARPNLRSIYSFLAQHVDMLGERVLTEDILKFVWEYGKTLAAESAGDDQYVDVFQQELKRLGEPALSHILNMTSDTIDLVCKKHLECDAKSLLFWEFFEMVMHYSRSIFQQRGDAGNLGLHVVITQVVGVLSAIVKVIDARGVPLPGEQEG
ncbi:unnamed protein product [Amoebophrya sp. A120]|nr:unnamed protein product [Amoebophrya sp. A120]|eukprot:GSA120T00007412001.1